MICALPVALTIPFPLAEAVELEEIEDQRSNVECARASGSPACRIHNEDPGF